MFFNKIFKIEIIISIVAFSFYALFNSCVKIKKLNKSMLFQYSTINAIAEGHYSSDFPVSELLKHGDFGIGTLEGLDGEMLIESGRVFQVKANGQTVEVDLDSKTPFAIVIPFKSDSSELIQHSVAFESFHTLLDGLRSSNNYFYGIRVKGTFSNIVTRSIPKQMDGRRLVDVVKEQQVVFQKQNPVKGVLVGFYFPPFMKDINVTGYHFHFMADDRSIAGHVLSIQLEDGVVEMDQVDQFSIQLPVNTSFRHLDLMNTNDDELNVIEKQR